MREPAEEYAAICTLHIFPRQQYTVVVECTDVVGNICVVPLS